MAHDKSAAQRIRNVLIGRTDVVERNMMGALCFMVGDNMCCGVTGSAVMVRVGRDHYESAIAEPNVRPLDIGGKAPKGFVLVDPPGYRSDAQLVAWIERGLHTVSDLPPKNRRIPKTSP